MIATIDWSNDVCNQHELGQTNVATIGETMFTSSVFPECQGSNPALELWLFNVSATTAPTDRRP